MNRSQYINMGKYFLIVSGTFLIIALVSYYIYFITLQATIEQTITQRNTEISNKIKSTLTPLILNHERSNVEATLNEFQQNPSILQLKVEYLKHVFNTKDIIPNRIKLTPSIRISDVTTDARFGEISILKTNYYEFLPVKDFDFSNNIPIKFQVLDNNQVQNLTTQFKFNSILNLNNKKEETHPYPNEFIRNKQYLTHTQNSEIIKETLHIANLHFTLIHHSIYENHYDKMITFLLYMLLLYLILCISFFIIIQYLKRNNVLTALRSINEVSNSILEDKFQKIDEKAITLQEAKVLSITLNKLFIKIASLSNEVNVQQNLLDKHKDTDIITNLANRNLFELEIKKMFITNGKGYIFIIKIFELQTIVDTIGRIQTDQMIKEFAKTLHTTVKEIDQINVTTYRFYGSEFALIAKKFDTNSAKLICEKILTNLKYISKEFNVQHHLLNIGATPFNPYGTTESILSMANDAYTQSLKEQGNAYCIIKEEHLEQRKNSLTESVFSTIRDESLIVEYQNETHLFDNPSELIMKEATPKLHDTQGNAISIGSFLKIAHENNLGVDFDQLVINNVIDYIKTHNINHRIAVNLMIENLSQESFLAWLKQRLSRDKSIAPQLVFSLTSATASEHKSLFLSFVNSVHAMNSHIILKRYSQEDFSIEELENIHVDYIRVHPNYTTNINDDNQKRQFLRNIGLFGNMNDIYILADKIIHEEDYTTVKKFNFYATSS